jgi:hypothetical protein
VRLSSSGGGSFAPSFRNSADHPWIPDSREKFDSGSAGTLARGVAVKKAHAWSTSPADGIERAEACYKLNKLVSSGPTTRRSVFSGEIASDAELKVKLDLLIVNDHADEPIRSDRAIARLAEVTVRSLRGGGGGAGRSWLYCSRAANQRKRDQSCDGQYEQMGFHYT